MHAGNFHRSTSYDDAGGVVFKHPECGPGSLCCLVHPMPSPAVFNPYIPCINELCMAGAGACLAIIKISSMSATKTYVFMPYMTVNAWLYTVVSSNCVTCTESFGNVSRVASGTIACPWSHIISCMHGCLFSYIRNPHTNVPTTTTCTTYTTSTTMLHIP